MGSRKRLLQPTLRLLLLVVAACAIYFAATASISRDWDVKKAVEAQDVPTVRRLAWWFPNAIRHNRETESIVLDAIDLGNDNTELIDAILVARPDLGPQGPNGDTPLTIAILSGQFAIARRLVDAGADPNEVGARGLRPLQCVAHRDRCLDLVEFLLEQGADPKLKSWGGRNFVQELVAWNQSDDCVKILELLADQRLLDVTEADSRGNTALHVLSDATSRFAPSQKDAKLIQFFLDRGADIDALNKDGQTPLFVAARTSVQSASPIKRDIWRFIPLEDWELDRIQLLLKLGAKLDFDERVMQEIFSEPTDEIATLRARDQRILAAGIAKADGISRCYWLGAYPGRSIWVYEGQVFNNYHGGGRPFAFADAENKRGHASTRQFPQLPVIPERDWDNASVSFDAKTKAVRCAVGDHWVEYDLLQRRPLRWSYEKSADAISE